jgi:predicted signal transduction protein with EAL and GGDEF domain
MPNRTIEAGSGTGSAEPAPSFSVVNRVRVTASFGVTIAARKSSASVDALIETADTALYRAKEAGSNQVNFLETVELTASSKEIGMGTGFA